MLLKGIILKGYSGFYYTLADGMVWVCSLRGKYRLKAQSFLPGDRVSIKTIEGNKAVIETVEPRRNELIRPPLANVDQIFIIMAFKRPEPDLWLLDRLLLTAQANAVSPVICFNKADLAVESEQNALKKIYGRLDFPFVVTSTKDLRGIAELESLMRDKVSVLAGPSGVGKSSLFNILEPECLQKTGEISEKLARGKHTTRHVELLRLSKGGLLADTPGFSQTILPLKIKRETLSAYYPDFEDLRNECRFKSCLHRQEPDCAVRESVLNGTLDSARYERYLSMLAEIIERESRF